MDTLEISSLSAEPADPSCGFTVCVFEVDQSKMGMDDFVKREEEFNLVEVPFEEEMGDLGRGLMCCASTDETYVEKWGQDAFDANYAAHGLPTIWGWEPTSGIRPCAVYLRHCVLAVSKAGVNQRARESFLDETYLADRETTVRMYLDQNPQVMETKPPESLMGRYSG